MQVGMSQRVCHAAGGTLPAGSAFFRFPAEQGRGKGESHRQFPAALLTAEQLGVGHTVLCELAAQQCLDFFLTYDFIV